MCRIHVYFIGHAIFLQRIDGFLYHRQITVTSHDNCNFFHFTYFLPDMIVAFLFALTVKKQKKAVPSLLQIGLPRRSANWISQFHFSRFHKVFSSMFRQLRKNVSFLCRVYHVSTKLSIERIVNKFSQSVCWQCCVCMVKCLTKPYMMNKYIPRQNVITPHAAW